MVDIGRSAAVGLVYQGPGTETVRLASRWVLPRPLCTGSTLTSNLTTRHHWPCFGSAGISRIRLPLFASFLTVRTIHLHHHHVVVTKEPGQTDTPRSGALNTNPYHRSKPISPANSSS